MARSEARERARGRWRQELREERSFFNLESLMWMTQIWPLQDDGFCCTYNSKSNASSLSLPIHHIPSFCIPNHLHQLHSNHHMQQLVFPLSCSYILSARHQSVFYELESQLFGFEGNTSQPLQCIWKANTSTWHAHRFAHHMWGYLSCSKTRHVNSFFYRIFPEHCLGSLAEWTRAKSGHVTGSPSKTCDICLKKSGITQHSSWTDTQPMLIDHFCWSSDDYLVDLETYSSTRERWGSFYPTYLESCPFGCKLIASINIKLFFLDELFFTMIELQTHWH